MTMAEYTGKVRRPKGSVSARVFKKDGTIIDLGQIAGDLDRMLTKEERKELEKKLKQLEKEAKHGS